MEIYLIRHGIAVDSTADLADADRWLTKQGIKKTLQVASSLRRLDLEFDIILASPLLRAQQTADLLISKDLSAKQEIHADLAPHGSLDSWIHWLQDYERTHPHAQRLALVGHEPCLSTWAEMLLFNQVFHRLHLKKAGIIALDWPTATHPIGNCQLNWLIPPKCWL